MAEQARLPHCKKENGRASTSGHCPRLQSHSHEYSNTHTRHAPSHTHTLTHCTRISYKTPLVTIAKITIFTTVSTSCTHTTSQYNVRWLVYCRALALPAAIRNYTARRASTANCKYAKHPSVERQGRKTNFILCFTQSEGPI